MRRPPKHRRTEVHVGHSQVETLRERLRRAGPIWDARCECRGTSILTENSGQKKVGFCRSPMTEPYALLEPSAASETLCAWRMTDTLCCVTAYWPVDMKVAANVPTPPSLVLRCFRDVPNDNLDSAGSAPATRAFWQWKGIGVQLHLRHRLCSQSDRRHRDNRNFGLLEPCAFVRTKKERPVSTNRSTDNSSGHMLMPLWFGRRVLFAGQSFVSNVS
jgi:hypothetical protein